VGCSPPVGEALSDAIERSLFTEVGSIGCNFGDGVGLRGVVGLLAGGEIAQPTADHLWATIRLGDLELVARSKGVTARGRDQCTYGSINLCFVQCQSHVPHVSSVSVHLEYLA
jgi:hypothetical protein